MPLVLWGKCTSASIIWIFCMFFLPCIISITQMFSNLLFPEVPYTFMISPQSKKFGFIHLEEL